MLFELAELILYRPANSAQFHATGGNNKEQVILAPSLNTLLHDLSNGPDSDIEMPNIHMLKEGENCLLQASPAAITSQDKLCPHPSQGKYPY